jgi:hypothetical protein
MIGQLANRLRMLLSLKNDRRITADMSGNYTDKSSAEFKL